MVDRGARPSFVPDRGHRITLRWLKGPMVGSSDEGRGARGKGAGSGIGRAHVYPRDEVGDLLVGQPAFLRRRHLEVFVLVANRLDESAALGISWHDGWCRGLAAFQESFARIEPQTAFELLGLSAVTFVTTLGQHGP